MYLTRFRYAQVFEALQWRVWELNFPIAMCLALQDERLPKKEHGI